MLSVNSRSGVVSICRTIILFILCLVVVTSYGQDHTDLRITQLTGNFYIYTTYNLYKGEKIPANGMYLVTNDGVALFDTPWDTTRFQPLLDSISAKHGREVKWCIATHFHDDRTAGLEYYAKKGIRTYTTLRTDELSKQTGRKRAQFLMNQDTVFNVGGHSFEVVYPGEGHTADNIIIWFKKERIIYGACLIKSVDDEDLGFLGDANKQAYAATLRMVQLRCPRPNYVIVGHGNWTNAKSLEHSLKMAEELRKQQHP